jgi:hypothetical protein
MFVPQSCLYVKATSWSNLFFIRKSFERKEVSNPGNEYQVLHWIPLSPHFQLLWIPYLPPIPRPSSTWSFFFNRLTSAPRKKVKMHNVNGHVINYKQHSSIEKTYPIPSEATETTVRDIMVIHAFGTRSQKSSPGNAHVVGARSPGVWLPEIPIRPSSSPRFRYALPNRWKHQRDHHRSSLTSSKCFHRCGHLRGWCQTRFDHHRLEQAAGEEWGFEPSISSQRAGVQSDGG